MMIKRFVIGVVILFTLGIGYMGCPKVYMRQAVGYATTPFVFSARCMRCDRPFTICKEHTTMYNVTYLPGTTQIMSGCGMAVLCEDCWQELTLKQRIIYYKKQLANWILWQDADKRKAYIDVVMKEEFPAVIGAVIEESVE